MDLEHTRVNISMDKQELLILSAITLHNIPEGLSVGVSYSSEQTGLGGLITSAIGLQNAPEGFLVALFLINQQGTRFKAFIQASLTGAMLFIVYKELIPESHGDGHARAATFSFLIGLLMMLGLVHRFG